MANETINKARYIQRQKKSRTFSPVAVVIMSGDLFVPDPYVTELNDDSFLPELSKSESHWCIAFYSGSCGHCQKYAPVWKRFAERATREGVCKVGAVNCDHVKELCSMYQVQSVPQLMTWNSKDISPNQFPIFDTSIQLHEGSDDELLAESTKVLKVKTDLGLRNMLRGAKELSGSTLRETKLKGLWDHMPSNVLPKDKLMLDRVPTKSEIVADAKTAVRFGFETGIFMGRYTLSTDEMNALLSWLKLLESTFPGEQNRVQLGWFRNQLTNDKGNVLTSEKWDDLLSRWSFGVDAHRELPIGAKIDSATFLSSTKRNVEKWKWRFCGDEVEGVHHGGYPCGLWLLFHQLTATTSARPSPEAAAKRRGMPSTPIETAHAIHGFISHFFSCETCRTNFIASNPNPTAIMARDSIQPVPGYSWEGRFEIEPLERRLILWAWQEHNAVSARLNAERLQDEEAAKASLNPDESIALLLPYTWRPQFPTSAMCNKCYLDKHRKPTLRIRKLNPHIDASVPNGPNALFREHDLVHQWDVANIVDFIVTHFCIGDSEVVCAKAKIVPSQVVSSFKATTNGTNRYVFIGIFICLVWFMKPMIHKLAKQSVNRKHQSRTH